MVTRCECYELSGGLSAGRIALAGRHSSDPDRSQGRGRAGIALAQQLEGHAAGLHHRHRHRHRIIGGFVVHQDQFYRCVRLCGHGARLHVSDPGATLQRLRHAGCCPGRLRR